MLAFARHISFVTPLRATKALQLALFVAFAATSLAPAAAAEDAWVKGEITLNLRTGPGTQYRIVGSVKTGDPVTILDRSQSWTKVVMKTGEEGWIPAGYLDPVAPPAVRLGQLEGESKTLRSQVESLSKEAQALRARNEELAARDDSQRSEVERLTMENMDLRAGERWPYLIAGALILSAGMIVGGIMHAISSSRRTRPRVRL